ncbi:MAG: cell division protein FtsL [Gammaproteobacteria bacterium]
MNRYLLTATLTLLVVSSALAVVYVKHENRKHFVELQVQQKKRDEMNIEWGQLQLEQSTWATHSRIEGQARKRLGMMNVPQDKVMIVKP